MKISTRGRYALRVIRFNKNDMYLNTCRFLNFTNIFLKFPHYLLALQQNHLKYF